MPEKNNDLRDVPHFRKPTYDEILDNQRRRETTGYAPNPDCVLCRGFGQVHPISLDNKVDYVKTIPCPGPDCLAASIQHWKETGEYLELKGVSSRLQTFEQFKIVAGTKATFEAFKKLADNPEAKPFLLCCGNVGCGKTHLCQALTTSLNKRGVNAYYYRLPDLIKALRASIETKDTDEWLNGLAKTGALILDDYGLEKETDWTVANLEDIIDARWQEKRITVLATNMDVDSLAPRIKSRFLDREISVYVLDEGRDYRKVAR